MGIYEVIPNLNKPVWTLNKKLREFCAKLGIPFVPSSIQPSDMKTSDGIHLRQSAQVKLKRDFLRGLQLIRGGRMI